MNRILILLITLIASFLNGCAASAAAQDAYYEQQRKTLVEKVEKKTTETGDSKTVKTTTEVETQSEVANPEAVKPADPSGTAAKMISPITQ